MSFEEKMTYYDPSENDEFVVLPKGDFKARVSGFEFKKTYTNKDNVQHWRTEVIANVITPLEWKTGSNAESKKETNEEIKSTDKGILQWV